MVRVAIDKRTSPVKRMCPVVELWALKPSLGPFESKVILGTVRSFFGPVWPDARGGVGHKPLGKHVLLDLDLDLDLCVLWIHCAI